jgi:hypothetical protein
MIMVALAALFVATSCELASGTDPNPNRKDNLLWGRVKEAVYQQYDAFKAVAHLNDILLEKEYADLAYRQGELTVDGDIYTLSYDSSNEIYRIKTDGKRLDEGGEWLIYYRVGTYMEFMKLGVANGIVGETAKFNLSIDNSAYGRSYYAYSYAAESEIEYWYDDVREWLCVKYNTFKGGSFDTASQLDYIIEFEAVEPLVIGIEIEEGKIDILYKDLIENTSRFLSVEIANRIVTFATSNGSNR